MTNNLDVSPPMMVEAESDGLCEKYVNQMVQVIDSKGYIL